MPVRQSNDPQANWTIVVVSTLALIVSNGLAIGGMPVFSNAIKAEFLAGGLISRDLAETFLANGANLTFIMSGVFSLIGGWLLTRFRIKPLMMVGCICLGTGLLIHSQAGSVGTVYLSRFLMGASLGFVGVAFDFKAAVVDTGANTVQFEAGGNRAAQPVDAASCPPAIEIDYRR